MRALAIPVVGVGLFYFLYSLLFAGAATTAIVGTADVASKAIQQSARATQTAETGGGAALAAGEAAVVTAAVYWTAEELASLKGAVSEHIIPAGYNSRDYILGYVSTCFAALCANPENLANLVAYLAAMKASNQFNRIDYSTTPGGAWPQIICAIPETCLPQAVKDAVLAAFGKKPCSEYGKG